MSVPDLRAGEPLPADLADLDTRLTTDALGRAVVFHAEVDSTMRLARDLAATAPNGLVVLADHQTDGRGRQGRTWADAPGAAILASLVVRLPPSVPPTRAVLALAVGVADGLAALGLDARLKWPNDVRVGGRKIAGMLALGVGTGAPGAAVVLGLGLNVRRAAVPPELAEVATSVEGETGEAVPRGRVLAAVLNAAEPWLSRTPDASALVARYAARLDGLGGPIALDTGTGVGTDDGVVHGTFEGVDDDGALRLRGPDGIVRRHHAGDVHVLKG